MYKKTFLFKSEKAYKRFMDAAGLRVYDNNNKIIVLRDVVNEMINIERRFSNQWSSSDKAKYLKTRENLSKLIDVVSRDGKMPALAATFLHLSDFKKIPGADIRFNNIIKLLKKAYRI